jgi:alpha-ribazole phosphatase
MAAIFIASGTPPHTRRLRAAKAFSTLSIGYRGVVQQLVEMYSGRDVIVVAHGGTIRAVLALALGLEPEAALAFTIENCSITRIDHIDGPGMGHGWRVVTVNRPPR